MNITSPSPQGAEMPPGKQREHLQSKKPVPCGYPCAAGGRRGAALRPVAKAPAPAWLLPAAPRCHARCWMSLCLDYLTGTRRTMILVVIELMNQDFSMSCFPSTMAGPGRS